MLHSKYLREKDIVKHEEFKWTAQDGKELYAQCWHASENIKAGILLVHGLGEHSSRYDIWSKWLAKEGYSVLSFDLRGHGKTPGKPADTSDYNKMLDDLDFLVEKGVEMCDNKPLFIYGHSFGGNLTANYVISKPNKIQGIILTSPWLELANIPPRHKFLMANILSRFFPKIKSKNGLRPEDISRELREVHKYRTDTRIHNKISIGLFAQAYERGIFAKRSIYKINVPVLVIHGSADNITSFNASREFVMNSGKKTTFFSIEGGYHELHNDSDKEKVFNIIVEWLNDQLNQTDAQTPNAG